jgi:hypothetical protein
MPALSLQFKFDQGTGTSTSTSVAIPSTQYSWPNSSLTFKSHKEKGAGYYGASSGFHTVTYTVTPNFLGTLTTQATLSTNPVEADWFTVDNSTVTYSNLIDPVTTTTTNFVNFTGNFVWVRALVQRTVDQPNGSVLAVNYNF